MRLLLADGHQLVRELIAFRLEAQGFSKVYTASSLDTVEAALATERHFDLILLDFRLPGMNGITGLLKVRRIAHQSRVAILCDTPRESATLEAIRGGAVGCIPKSMGAEEFIRAVRTILQGIIYLPDDLPWRAEPGLANCLATRHSDVLNIHVKVN